MDARENVCKNVHVFQEILTITSSNDSLCPAILFYFKDRVSKKELKLYFSLMHVKDFCCSSVYAKHIKINLYWQKKLNFMSPTV